MPSADVTVIRPELPTHLPPNAFVADVKFDHPEGGWAELFKGAHAHIRRVIQGEYRGDVVIVRDSVGPGQIRITCYDPIRFGGSGYIIGTPTGYENGLLVLQPTFAPAITPIPGNKP